MKITLNKPFVGCLWPSTMNLQIGESPQTLRPAPALYFAAFTYNAFHLKSNTTPAYLTMPCAPFFSTNSPAPALVCYNSPFLIPRPNAILENDKDVHTRTVGISLRVHSFQARVSGQIFICREFRPIKFEYYSRVLVACTRWRRASGGI